MPGDEAVSLTTLFKDVKPDDLDKFLSTFTKYERIFDKSMAIVEKLDKMGILPAAIRSVGAKAGVQDIDKPLKNPLNIAASSPTHYEFFRYLNKAQSDKIEQMHEALKTAVKAQAPIDVEVEEVKEDEGIEEDENTLEV